MFLHTLDNTSWSIADIIGPIGTGTHNFLINFTANETEYASIHFVGDANSGHVYYDDTLVASYPRTVWEDAAYQQIAIAGGIDATNPTLLAWFKQYAKNATPSGGDVDIIGALNDIAEAISGGGSGGGLPDTTEASAGDVLSLDEDKKPTWSTPSGGGTPVGQILWQGTVTSTPQEMAVDHPRVFDVLPVAVATLNGKLARFEYEYDENDGPTLAYVVEHEAAIIVTFDPESHKYFVVADGSDSGIDVVIADVGNRCYIAEAGYQNDSGIYISGHASLFNQLVGIGAALFIHISGTYNNAGLNTMLPATIDDYSGQLHLSTIGSCRGQYVTWTIDEDGYIVGSINDGGDIA